MHYQCIIAYFDVLFCLSSRHTRFKIQLFHIVFYISESIEVLREFNKSCLTIQDVEVGFKVLFDFNKDIFAGDNFLDFESQRTFMNISRCYFMILNDITNCVTKAAFIFTMDIICISDRTVKLLLLWLDVLVPKCNFSTFQKKYNQNYHQQISFLKISSPNYNKFIFDTIETIFFWFCKQF